MRVFIDCDLLLEVAPVGTSDARRALDLPMADIEDAFQAAAALAWKADVISTRNLAHFRRSPVKAVHPKALVGRLNCTD